MLSSTSLLHGSCVFNRNNTVATQQGMKTYWLCKSYRVSMCRARCITHQGKIISATGAHNHPPHVKGSNEGGTTLPPPQGHENGLGDGATTTSQSMSPLRASSKSQFVTVSVSSSGGHVSSSQSGDQSSLVISPSSQRQLPPNKHNNHSPGAGLNHITAPLNIGQQSHPQLGVVGTAGPQVVPVQNMMQTVFNPNVFGQVITGVSSTGTTQMVLTPIQHHSTPAAQQVNSSMQTQNSLFQIMPTEVQQQKHHQQQMSHVSGQLSHSSQGGDLHGLQYSQTDLAAAEKQQSQ